MNLKSDQQEAKSAIQRLFDQWGWYVVGSVLIYMVFLLLLTFIANYRSLWVLLLSLLILGDAFLIMRHELGRNAQDTMLWAVVYGVLGFSGVVFSIILWHSIPILIHDNSYVKAPIAFITTVLTTNVLRSIFVKKAKS